jgi:hypothetical protein
MENIITGPQISPNIFKSIISTIVVLFVILIMVMTNPSKADYVNYVEENISQNGSNILEAGLINVLGAPIIDSGTISKNYLIFTIYDTNIENNHLIVLGICKNFLPLSNGTSTQTAGSNQPALPTQAAPQPAPSVPTTTQQTYYTEPTMSSVAANIKEIQMVNAGTVTITGIDGTFSLPVMAIAGSYGLPPEPNSVVPTTPIAPISLNLPASQVNVLTVYFFNDAVTFLGPRGWKAIQASMGVDGSMGVTLVPGDGSTGWMTVGDDGADQGCTIEDIGQWVPGMQSWASQNSVSDFEYKPFLYPVSFATLGTHSQGLSYAGDPPNTTNGVIYYNLNGSSGAFFGQELIMLPGNEHSIETTILNSFLAYTTAQWSH